MDHKKHVGMPSELGVGHKKCKAIVYTHKVNNSYKQKTYLTHFTFLC